MHFAAGAAASKATRDWAGGTPFASCAAALTVGIAKEWYDHRYGGVVDADDAWVTAAGCAYTIKF